MKIETIKIRFEEIQSGMSSVVADFPWENRQAYLLWLAQTYEYAVATTRLLALTGGNIPMNQTPLASRFIQHATEEKGHDKLLENDAKALGERLSDFKVLPEAEAFHKSVYYWIYQHRAPVVMGWALFLEGFAVRYGASSYERAVKAHGKKGTSFLRVHTQEDPDHVEKAFSALQYFSPEELKDVVHGLEVYSKLYSNIYSAIVASVPKQENKAA